MGSWPSAGRRYNLCRPEGEVGLSAEALIDLLIGAVQAFAGDEPQGDDMTWRGATSRGIGGKGLQSGPAGGLGMTAPKCL